MSRGHGVPRKKACQECSQAKARCDLVKPSCSRCLGRGLQCSFSDQANATPGAEDIQFAGPASVLNPLTPSSAATNLRDVTAGSVSSPSVYGAASWSGAGTAQGGAATPASGASSLFNIPSSTSSRRNNPPPLIESSDTAVDFSRVSDLVSPVDVVRIRDRWLDFYFTPVDKRAKNYSAPTMSLIARTLKSYPAAWVRDSAHVPPFIHTMQYQCRASNVSPPEPLSNCLSLLRMCAHRAPGSERMVAACIEREMQGLVEGFDPTDHADSLARLQAYLLYSITTYACSTETDTPSEACCSGTPAPNANPIGALFAGATITTLQELTAKASAAGLVCPEELGGTGTGTTTSSPAAATPSPTAAAALARPSRPAWESWILAEAKRRTVDVVYMLENLHNFRHGAASYLGEELALLPAPAGRHLWQAPRRTAWEREYDAFLAAWGGAPGLRLAEFWPMPMSMPLMDPAVLGAPAGGMLVDREEEEERGIGIGGVPGGIGMGGGGDDVVGESAARAAAKRRRARRLDLWAEGIDEFGMFILAVCTVTHGG